MSHKRTKKKITLAVAVLLTKIVFALIFEILHYYTLSLSLSLSMCLHVAWKWINYFSVFWCVPEFIIA